MCALFFPLYLHSCWKQGRTWRTFLSQCLLDCHAMLVPNALNVGTMEQLCSCWLASKLSSFGDWYSPNQKLEMFPFQIWVVPQLYRTSKPHAHKTHICAFLWRTTCELWRGKRRWESRLDKRRWWHVLGAGWCYSWTSRVDVQAPTCMPNGSFTFPGFLPPPPPPPSPWSFLAKPTAAVAAGVQMS